MKTAIYIEDGVVQLVMTPETEFEKNALSTFQERPLEVKLFTGSFYDCRGGWVRQAHHRPAGDYVLGRMEECEDRSLILRVADAGARETREGHEKETEQGKG